MGSQTRKLEKATGMVDEAKLQEARRVLAEDLGKAIEKFGLAGYSLDDVVTTTLLLTAQCAVMANWDAAKWQVQAAASFDRELERLAAVRQMGGGNG